ncbi:MAG TPA: amylo-alpha-1,6-glucosidase [Pyrinomonadaceae bacterium]|jgi:glycogen debranching enzyme|nr:amylo-alpha-1,6-glucosidase [Pyrinomonadaceae bacterium]
MISFGADECARLDAASRREWLETDGLGGFASSTITGQNTRRYHGLLVAADPPPTRRVVLLSKLEEVLVVGDARFELSTNLYEPGVVSPQGHLLQTGFRLDPFPVFTYRAGAFEIEKKVFMPHGRNTTVVRYRFDAPPGARAELEVRPLVAFRDYHSLAREALDIFLHAQIKPGLLRLGKRDDSLTLFLAHDARAVSLEGLWYRNFEYAEERERGFDCHEDLFNPCLLTFDASGGSACDIIASTESCDAGVAATLEESGRERRRGLSLPVVGIHAQAGASVDAAVSSTVRRDAPGTRVAPEDGHAEEDGDSSDEEESAAHLQSLARAADQFIVRRGENLSTVIAGYHWFTDWGRDTMISLTGLALATRRFDEAREILLAFAASLDQGLIPNRFPDAGERPEYNTADATLWFVNAVGEYLRRAQDERFVREKLYEPLLEIVRWHERGTRYEIRMTEDSLLRAGDMDVQVTWMDVKLGDYLVTPRTGKPVEIQALWYNALRTVESIARRFGDEPTRNRSRAVADAARASFHGLFWNEAEACLFDCVGDAGEADDSLRPNQIFAVSLPHAITTGERARAVVRKVEQELLTPFGLRSLSPRHPEYRGRYEGDAYSRDTAYHQGTVWAWLLGPFITAYLRVNDRSPESVAAARGWLRTFRAHLRDAGLGQISEIFDGDAPHAPRGCVAQAWSVAEILRCELEEVG